MKTLILVLLSALPLANVSYADDVRTISLAKIDSGNFRKVLTGYSDPETVIDDNDKGLWHVIRKYEAPSGGLQIVCSTGFQSGMEGMTDCTLTFNLSKSTPALDVHEGKVGGALVAIFNDSNEATKLNHNLGSLPLLALEKVAVRGLDGSTQSFPRVRMDCDRIPNTGGIARSCTLVAIPDQVN